MLQIRSDAHGRRRSRRRGSRVDVEVKVDESESGMLMASLALWLCVFIKGSKRVATFWMGWKRPC